MKPEIKKLWVEDLRANIIGITINPRPTKSQVPKRSWIIRRLCRHRWVLLYQESLMFFQEHVGDALHYVCPRCGTTKIVEKE